MASHRPQIHTLLTAVPLTQIPAGTILFTAGDVGDTAYLLLDGRVALAREPSSTTSLDLGRMGLALTFGTEALLRRPYAATATVEEDSNALLLRLSHLDALSSEDPFLVATIQRNLAPH